MLEAGSRSAVVLGAGSWGTALASLLAERGVEVQLLIKSHPSRRAELEAAVHQLHSYSTPEWIHWQAQCSLAYASWLATSWGLSPGDAAPAPPDEQATSRHPDDARSPRRTDQ